MLECLQHLACGRRVLISLGIFLVMLLAMNLAATWFYHVTGGYGMLDLGGGANLFDDRGSYTPGRAYTLIAHYGQSGRHVYYALLMADMFFPPLFGIFAVLAMTRALAVLVSARRRPYLLLLLPLAYVLADWCENAGILGMLLNYPHELFALAQYTDSVRAGKNILAKGSLLAVAVTWLLVLWRRRIQVR